MNASFMTALLAMAAAAPIWAAEDFTGTKEVRLIQGDLGSPTAKTVVVTDKAKIEKLLGTITLTKKVPCACDHINHAMFVKEKGEITVSLCDHCFDVGKNTYVMPSEFYKLYTAFVQETSTPKPNDSPRPVAAGKTAAQPGYAKTVTAEDIAFVFSDQQVVPDQDLPREARAARSADGKDHGAFSKVVAGSVSAITVTHFEPKILKGKKETQEFLHRLLTIPTGSTYQHVPWAQMLGVPSVAATVRHAQGRPGTWLVWYAYPSVYCAYQDGSGKWWFGVWFQEEKLQLERTPLNLLKPGSSTSAGEFKVKTVKVGGTTKD